MTYQEMQKYLDEFIKRRAAYQKDSDELYGKIYTTDNVDSISTDKKSKSNISFGMQAIDNQITYLQDLLKNYPDQNKLSYQKLFDMRTNEKEYLEDQQIPLQTQIDNLERLNFDPIDSSEEVKTITKANKENLTALLERQEKAQEKLSFFDTKDYYEDVQYVDDFKEGAEKTLLIMIKNKKIS